jgi:arylsulfatase B
MCIPLIVLLLSSVLSSVLSSAAPPHIVYLVIDDWGWANLANHRLNDTVGNDEFPTPNLSALASEGMLLDRLYAHKFCGPSRAAIQTGRNPIHVTVLDNALTDHNPKDPMGGFQGIPRNMTGIATKLRTAGYHTHFAGKWHCGLATFDHIPSGRGYDTSLNYFDAANDYFTNQVRL